MLAGKDRCGEVLFLLSFGEESYRWFVVLWATTLFYFIRAMFGYAPCPYYTSTWVDHQGMPAAFMVDDWLTAGSTDEQAKKNLATKTSVFVFAGFVMAVDKEEAG